MAVWFSLVTVGSVWSFGSAYRIHNFFLSRNELLLATVEYFLHIISPPQPPDD
jgi:hypothetical protein